MNFYLRPLAAAALSAAFASASFAQTAPPKPDKPAAPVAQDKANQDKKPAAPAPKPGDLKKYEDVITKEAQTQVGVFKVHRIDDRIYWEIPANLVGRLFLWQTEISEQPAAIGYPGTAAGTRLVRFSRRGNKMYLRNVDLSVRSAATGAIEDGVHANSIEPIIGSYEVLTEGEGKSAVIDVTGLFTSDPQDFAIKPMIGGMMVDGGRSYVDRVRAFPTNIETRSQLTFMMQPNRGLDTSAATVVVHYSLDLLPEKPMMGRLKDSRIGYFTTDFTEYGRKENRAVERRFINRFRLEKKDPSAALSEPVKPIVFYLSREVPEKWRTYLKQAIEDWQPAFERAGFKNAILAKDAPTMKEDPNWDPEDARYSVVRWAPSTTENAMGPSIQDPRSGETISAHIIVWNDIARLVEDWYFSQCAATDPRARHLPFSDELTGRLLRYVLCHEVGHTLGLEHNFKGSVAYSIAQLRDPKFTAEHGVAASIMSYSRYNYVAQPGDGVTSHIGILGPYDKFAIEYGYKPIESATSPDDEKRALDIFLSKQIADPTLRFGNYRYYGVDPTTQMENISNDPVEAGRLGLMNLDRIAADYLLSSTSKFGEEYDSLSEMHNQLLNQRFTEMIHIANLVGGVVETDYHVGRGSQVFNAVPAAQQAAAVKFLTTQGFKTPPTLFTPKILGLIRPSGAVDSAASLQNYIMLVLLSEPRLHRLQDAEALNGADAYTIGKLVRDVTAGAWTELDDATPKIDIYRRTLQRTFLRSVDSRINGAAATRTDLKPLMRDELKRLATRIDKAIARTKDGLTASHLADSRRDIERILDGKFAVGRSGSGSILDMFGIKANPNGCWDPAATLREAIKEAGE